MDEQERQTAIDKIAIDMYNAGMGDCRDVLERLTRPQLDLVKFRLFPDRMPTPEPTPYERGVLSRYQGGYKKPRHTRKRR